MVSVSGKVFRKWFREVQNLERERERLNSHIYRIDNPFSFLCWICEYPAPSEKQGKMLEILISKNSLAYNEENDHYSCEGELELIFVFEKMIAKVVK